MIASLVLGEFLSLIGAANAQAQNVCADRNMVVERLNSGYSEEPVAMGLLVNGSIVEVFASKDGSFTIIATRPSGVSCILVTGESWEGVIARKADFPI